LQLLGCIAPASVASIDSAMTMKVAQILSIGCLMRRRWRERNIRLRRLSVIRMGAEEI
jgi:hypothetical protein